MLIMLLMSGCAASPPTTRMVYRQASAPIYSSAAFDLSRLEGRWQQIATFSATVPPDCTPGVVEFSRKGGGVQMTGRLCLPGRQIRLAGPVTVTGPGRFTVPGMEEWWVVWVDVGYRTLAIGTPGGAWGFVLDEGRISDDRLQAAREIFDFNGYPASRLVSF